MTIQIPDLCLVLLIGPSGSGKSTFARRHFQPTEVISSDQCRALVSDDENDQSATGDAFDLLHFIAARRLAGRRLAVIDATNIKPEDRRPLVQLARDYHVLPVALVFDLPERICHERNAARPDRSFGPHVIRGQKSALRRGLRGLKREGIRYVHTFTTVEEVDDAVIERTPLWTDRRHEHGPFDIIGDIHGCYDELVELLGRLDYAESCESPAACGAGNRVSCGTDLQHVPAPAGNRCQTDASIAVVNAPAGFDSAASSAAICLRHPAGRRAIFLGDLVDRGPKAPQVLRLVMNMVRAGSALCIPGNHDVKLLKKLQGRDVRIAHGLAETLAQLDADPVAFHAEVAAFLDSLVSHFLLDDGRLVVAHAGMKESMQGRASGAVREFALYGETTGESDEFGLPVRCNWAADYRGRALVVYGHTPVHRPEWLNGTINIDTGCVFGGSLTALRYPERELVSVPARRAYAEAKKPFMPAITGEAPAGVSAQQAHDDVLDIGDLVGKRIIHTRLHGNVIVGAEQSAAALEAMSRFAVDPRWLIYLPPTMSPCETSNLADWLEHPAEAFAYFRNQGIPRVICQEKHMGSRAVVVVCRDTAAALRRFGVTVAAGAPAGRNGASDLAGSATVEDSAAGMIYTRTGRRFFDDATLEAALLERLRMALDAAGFWEEMKTDWVCLDCELMPWSAKAQALLKEQYAAVGAAATAALAEAWSALAEAGAAALDVGEISSNIEARRGLAAAMVSSYRHYCWPVNSVEDLKLAPFHLLATEGGMHVDRDHMWHMQTLASVCNALPAERGGGTLLMPTSWRVVDLTDPDSERDATEWWIDLTSRGGEGMVVKPHDFVARGPRGLIQPAVKCRGREYLRIIYGPDYTLPQHLERLRQRGLARKRNLALREFALGIEALERFHRREPLRRVHECVFGVLAMESEPVDPRL